MRRCVQRVLHVASAKCKADGSRWASTVVIDVSRGSVSHRAEREPKGPLSKETGSNEAVWAEKGRGKNESLGTVVLVCWKERDGHVETKYISIYGKCGNNLAGATRRRR